MQTDFLFDRDTIKRLKEAGCTVTYLTSYDKDKVDWTRRGERFLAGFMGIEDITNSRTLDRRLWKDHVTFDTFWEQWWRKVEKSTFATAHSELMAYNQYCKKFVGIQGESFSRKDMLNHFYACYENAKHKPVLHDIILGRDYLMRLIKQRIETYGYPQPVYSPRHSTSGCLPVMGHKGDFLDETACAGDHEPALPIIPGQRHMRNKRRTICQCPTNLVRNLEDHLATVRQWLSRYVPEFFGAWLNESKYVRPLVTKAINRGYFGVETDYESMDIHYSPELARQVVYPIWELLLPFGSQHLLMHVDESWREPVYFGDVMLEGEHDLFSGQPITNDVETVTQACQRAGAAIASGQDPLSFVAFHQGDDQAALFRDRVSAERYMSAFIEESNANNLVMKPEKCCLRDSVVMFCRKFYYKRAYTDYNVFSDNYDMLGAYPSTLALNQILTPEGYSSTRGQLAVATYQRMDNLIGAPDYTLALQHVMRNSTLRDIAITAEDIQVYSAKDWWYRLYGEVWQPESSPTWRLLHQ